ncbi:hypothetical protein QVZ41_11770 [Wenyingzhuangia sp. chi5]|uniref:PKD domain-containing protein n=1 Tax=Wenyingzhuangia gilva TaxID=3057677 RepID=A0ABT8VU73_9FLAO|nr:hypothetical protein [Wenyingzhuangia sp. chi5]MDO3695517.1 hypothetical protein [Wenyingzhuangia sp. chi5]
MKLLKQGKYVLLALSIIACSKDEDVAGSGSATITNLTFTSVGVDDTGKVVGVTPTSSGGSNTVYTVDFGDPSAVGDSDVKQTSGPQVTYEYPAATATYDITVTADADKAAPVSVTKQHTVTFEAATSIADFEDEASLNLRNDTSGSAATIVVESKTGKNGSASNVGVITNVGSAYEAVSINLTKHIDVKSKSILTLDFYQATATETPVLLKFEGAKTANGFDIEVLTNSTATAGWQTLTFDFGKDAVNSYPNQENTTVTLDEFQKLVVFVGFAVEQSGVFYVDNIAGSTVGTDVPDTDSDGVIDSIDKCKTVAGNSENDGCPDVSEPTDAPTTPTVLETNVISLFSDAYTDVNVTTWRTDWSMGNYEEKTIATNPVKIYTSLDYAGIETVGDNLIDASEMTHVHVDIWSGSATGFQLKIVDFGADKAYAGGDDSEGLKLMEGFAQGQWVSFDFPLSDFTGLANKTNIAQFVINGFPSGQVDVVIDNFYLYK